MGRYPRWIEELDTRLTKKQKGVLEKISAWDTGKVYAIPRKSAVKKFGKRTVNSLVDRGLIRRLEFGNRKYYQTTDMGEQVISKHRGEW